jgi:hypothetical protein
VSDRLGGSRTISVDLAELELGYNASTLRREVEQVTSMGIEAAMFVATCPKLILDVRPGCAEDAGELIQSWMEALAVHIQDLQTDRFDELFSTYVPSLEDAVARGSNWSPVGRAD